MPQVQIPYTRMGDFKGTPKAWRGLRVLNPCWGAGIAETTKGDFKGACPLRRGGSRKCEAL